jgi:hypothetical protein
MSKMNDLKSDPVLAEIVRRLVTGFTPKRVFLFGSRARGDAHEQSDYDLLVIVSGRNVACHQLAQQAHLGILRDIPIPIDVIFMTEEKFEERKKVIGSLPETAVYEGKELYAA